MIKSNILHYKKPAKKGIGETHLNIIKTMQDIAIIQIILHGKLQSTSTKLKSSNEHGTRFLHTDLTRQSARRMHRYSNGRGACGGLTLNTRTLNAPPENS